MVVEDLRDKTWTRPCAGHGRQASIGRTPDSTAAKLQRGAAEPDNLTPRLRRPIAIVVFVLRALPCRRPRLSYESESCLILCETAHSSVGDWSRVGRENPRPSTELAFFDLCVQFVHAEIMTILPSWHYLIVSGIKCRVSCIEVPFACVDRWIMPSVVRVPQVWNSSKAASDSGS